MKYTLYYQPNCRDIVAVAESDYLLKLLKIEKTTFHRSKGFSYIVKTEDGLDPDAFSYGISCLSRNSHAEYMRFCKAVDGGKYFKTYDYSYRVRARHLATL